MFKDMPRVAPENQSHAGWHICLLHGVTDGVMKMATVNRKVESQVTFAMVDAELIYEPDSGLFLRKCGRNRGKKAGYRDNTKGYNRIHLFGRKFVAGRVAWLLTYGEWPESSVDHINGDPGDDRLVNLRLADDSEQQWNKGLNRNNSSGVKGVSFNKRRAEANLPPWETYITIAYKRVHLGFFEKMSDAITHRQKAEVLYHDEFARNGV